MAGSSTSLEDAVTHKIDTAPLVGSFLPREELATGEVKIHCMSDGGNEVEFSATEAGPQPADLNKAEGKVFAR